MKPPPDRTPAAEAARQARLVREAAALRANLHRRKAQARAAAAVADPQPPPEPPVTPGPDVPTDPEHG